MKSRYFTTLLLLLASIVANGAQQVVYVIKIDDEIGSTTWRYTREALNEATRLKSDFVVVHLNTYGGSVMHADSIRTALIRHRSPTICFIDNNAASAGALIALACDSVFMTPDASIGAATVVNGIEGAAMPDKYQSYMRSIMRATAQRHGVDSVGKWRRNPTIAEGMVDSRISIPGIVDSTQVITFTSDEAIQQHFADGKASSVKDVLEQLNITDYRIENYSPSWVDAVMGFFTNPAIQAILIMIIVGGIYFELHTAGMGFPSMAAIIAAILYFLPLYLTGIVSSWIVIIFLLGVILILLELFVVPGFGITGISGIVAVVAAIFIGLLENFAETPEGFDSSAVWKAVGTLGAGIALSIGAIIYLTSKHAPISIRRHTELTLSQRIEEGYIGVDSTLDKYVGRKAVTATDMHPGGKIEIDGESLDAISMHGFIDVGTTVVVKRYENAQLYVEPLNG